MIPTLCNHTHTLTYKSTQTKNLTNYVYQESKDNKTYIQLQTKYGLVTSDYYSVYDCNETGSFKIWRRKSHQKVIKKLN